MSPDSKQWALDRMERANAIHEPDEVPWRIQLLDLIVWAIEVGLICYLVFSMFLTP